VRAFSFDVTVSTHDLLKLGITEARFVGAEANHHRIVVAAETVEEAALVAAQMASCKYMCTGVYYRY
jgi:hypothetical protein